MVDKGKLKNPLPAFGPFPTKKGCGLETKKERLARRKSYKALWGSAETKKKRQEANAEQRRCRKEAEVARRSSLGPQVCFRELFFHESQLTVPSATWGI